MIPAVRAQPVEGVARRLLALWEANSPTQSPHTLRARRADLAAFGRWAGLDLEGEDLRLAAVELLIFGTRAEAVESVTHWRAEQRRQGYRAATIARRIATLRSLISTAQDVGLPWKLTVKGPPVRRGRLRVPSIDRARRTIERLDPTDPLQCRDRAILCLLVFCALRRAEVSALDLGDFRDGADPGLTISGKGGHREEIGCAELVRDAVAAWVRLRGREPGPLFSPLGRPGQRLSPEQVARRCKARGLGAPHRWRHAAVDRLLRQGHTLAAQRLARHANLSTTDRYAGRAEDLAGWASRLLAGELEIPDR